VGGGGTGGSVVNLASRAGPCFPRLGQISSLLTVFNCPKKKDKLMVIRPNCGISTAIFLIYTAVSVFGSLTCWSYGGNVTSLNVKLGPSESSSKIEINNDVSRMGKLCAYYNFECTGQNTQRICTSGSAYGASATYSSTEFCNNMQANICSMNKDVRASYQAVYFNFYCCSTNNCNDATSTSYAQNCPALSGGSSFVQCNVRWLFTMAGLAIIMFY
jgi:hypothetical protein